MANRGTVQLWTETGTGGPVSKALLVLLPLALLGQVNAASSADVTKLDATVRAALTKCGVSVKLNAALNQGAIQGLQGLRTQELLDRQGYVAQGAYTLRFNYFGDLAEVSRTILNDCSTFQRFTEYGLATNGTRLAMVVAKPATVDLTRSREWLSQFLTLTNRARFQGQKCGGKLMNAAPPLRWDSRLEAAAAKHVHDMTTLNFRGHVNPVDGTRAQQRAAALGFRGLAGENIHYGGTTPQEAIASLLKSPEHCENLMNPRYTLFGAAVGNGTPKTLFATYWVQVFGVEK